MWYLGHGIYISKVNGGKYVRIQRKAHLFLGYKHLPSGTDGAPGVLEQESVGTVLVQYSLLQFALQLAGSFTLAQRWE